VGIGSHTKPNNGESVIWLTPPYILHALGTFDFDPCACSNPRPWATAREHISLPDDGLNYEWKNRVWCNPPYGDETGIWLKRMADHGHGTALIFARTETETWEKWVWGRASAVFFFFGRLYFYYPDGTRAGGNAGGPSALVAYGESDAQILATTSLKGKFVSLK
jgi:hypothetical protein